MKGHIRTACAHCGEVFTMLVNTLKIDSPTPCCPLCRDEIIKLMESYQPCCREAYIRGRLASARDNNDQDMIRILGSMLDKMRDDAFYR